jgi:hypothetical protein
VQSLQIKLLNWALASISKDFKVSDIVVNQAAGSTSFSFSLSIPVTLKERRKIRNYFQKYFLIERHKVNANENDTYVFTPLTTASIDFSLLQANVDNYHPEELANFIHQCNTDEKNIVQEFIIAAHFNTSQSQTFQTTYAALYFYQLKYKTNIYSSIFDPVAMEDAAKKVMLEDSDFALEVAQTCINNNLPIPKQAIKHMVELNDYLGKNKEEIYDLYLEKKQALEIEAQQENQENQALINLERLYLATKNNANKKIKRFAITLSDHAHNPTVDLPIYLLNKYLFYIMDVLKEDNTVLQWDKVDCLIILHQVLNINKNSSIYKDQIQEVSFRLFGVLVTKYPHNNQYIQLVLNNMLTEVLLPHQAEQLVNYNNPISNQILINYIENTIYKRNNNNARSLLKRFITITYGFLDNYPKVARLFSELSPSEKTSVAIELKKIKNKTAGVFELLIKYYNDKYQFTEVNNLSEEAINHRVYINISTNNFNKLLQTPNARKIDIICFYKKLSNTERTYSITSTFRVLADGNNVTSASNEQKDFVQYIISHDLLDLLTSEVARSISTTLAQQLIDVYPQRHTIRTSELAKMTREISTNFNSNPRSRAVAQVLQNFCTEDRELSTIEKTQIYCILRYSNETDMPQLYNRLKDDVDKIADLYNLHFYKQIQELKSAIVALKIKEDNFLAQTSTDRRSTNNTPGAQVDVHFTYKK